MTKVTFIRHGESEANLRRENCGATDFGEMLTPKWQEQAMLLGQELKAYDFDIVYASDMVRAIETVKLVFPERDDIILDPRIREYFPGNDWTHKYGEWPREQFADIRIRWFNTGETYAEQIKRVSDFLVDCAKLDAQHIAVVTHLWTFRILSYLSWRTDLRTSLIMESLGNTSTETNIIKVTEMGDLEVILSTLE